MLIQGKKEIAEATLTALAVTVATELAKWAVEVLKNRKPVEKDATGAIVVE